MLKNFKLHIFLMIFSTAFVSSAFAQASERQTDVACYDGDKGVEVTSLGPGGDQKIVTPGFQVVGVKFGQAVPEPTPIPADQLAKGKADSENLWNLSKMDIVREIVDNTKRQLS